MNEGDEVDVLEKFAFSATNHYQLITNYSLGGL